MLAGYKKNGTVLTNACSHLQLDKFKDLNIADRGQYFAGQEFDWGKLDNRAIVDSYLTAQAITSKPVLLDAAVGSKFSTFVVQDTTVTGIGYFRDGGNVIAKNCNSDFIAEFARAGLYKREAMLNAY